MMEPHSAKATRQPKGLRRTLPAKPPLQLSSMIDASTVPDNFVLDGRGPLGALGKAAPVADNNVFGQAETAQAAVGSHYFAVDGFAIVGHDNAEIDVASPLDGGPLGLRAEEVDLLGRKLVPQTAYNFLGLRGVQHHVCYLNLKPF